MQTIEYTSSSHVNAYCGMKATLDVVKANVNDYDSMNVVSALHDRNKAIARVNNLPVDRFI